MSKNKKTIEDLVEIIKNMNTEIQELKAYIKTLEMLRYTNPNSQPYIDPYRWVKKTFWNS